MKARTERAQFRKRAGLTQHQLAKRARVHTSRISLWENGEIELTPAEVERIAAVITAEINQTSTISTANDLARTLAPANFRVAAEQVTIDTEGVGTVRD